MAEEPAGTTPQAGTEPAPQAGQKSETTPGQSAQPGDAGNSQAEIARLMAELKEVRAEAAKHRTELRAAQEKLTGFEQQQLSESEKLQKRAEQAERTAQEAAVKLTEITIRAEVFSQAQKLGIVDLDAAFKLVDRSAIKINDNGQVEGADKAVAALVKDRPWLLAATGGTSATNPQRGAGGVPESNPIVDRIRQVGMNPFDPANLTRK